MPVGLAEPPEVGTEEAAEDEDTAAEPNYAFAKGWVGGWGPRYLVPKRERGPARVPRLVGRTVRI